MNVQVQKLEELLERVQRNRAKPRVGSAAAPAAARPAVASEPEIVVAHEPAVEAPPMAQPAPAREEKPAARERISQPAPAPAARGKYPTPFEEAVEEQLAQPEPARQPAAAPEPVRTARLTPGRPLRITPAELTRAAGAVASVVSPHPDAEAATFGELLRRSLSLRPR
jgi:hypothetical protein